MFFNGTRYLLEPSNRNELGQFARTYKVIERVEIDECEDPDIWTPRLGEAIASSQAKWYRQINDDHRGLDYYDRLWSQDEALLAEDVKVYPDLIEFHCPSHSLITGDYVSCELFGSGAHEITVDGEWIGLKLTEIAADECEEAESLLRNAVIVLITLRRIREHNIDTRDQYYDGGEDTIDDQIELKLDNLEEELE